MFENRVLRKTYGPKGDEQQGSGGVRREHYDLYYSSNIFRGIK
jgi:hypothetical protein